MQQFLSKDRTRQLDSKYRVNYQQYIYDRFDSF